jgi:hypothetical protein
MRVKEEEEEEEEEEEDAVLVPGSGSDSLGTGVRELPFHQY